MTCLKSVTAARLRNKHCHFTVYIFRYKAYNVFSECISSDKDKSHGDLASYHTCVGVCQLW